MNKILLLLISITLFACNKEEKLSPSFTEKDRLTAQLDLSKPLVKAYKDKYDVNILLNFSDTLDFKFGMWKHATRDQWANFNISHIAANESDANLALFDEIVLQCFQDEITTPKVMGAKVYQSDFKKKYFPHKILLADTVTTDGNKASPDVILTEAEVMAISEDTWYGLWNGYEQLFAVSKPQWDKLSTTNKSNVRKRMLFSFLVNMFHRHNLYAQVPAEFFTPVLSLHNMDINALALLEQAPSHPTNSANINVQWYIDKGMVLSKRSPIVTSAAFAFRLERASVLYFPNKAVDVRNFLNVIICENSTTSTGPIRGYYLKSPVFKQRMKIMIEMLYSWGIDVFQINPVMAEFYN